MFSGICSAPFGETFVQRGDNLVIAFQFDSQRCRHSFARQVILRRSHAAHKDGEVDAANRSPSRRCEMFEVVANNRLEGDTDPKFVETAGEEQGIGVLPVRSQHLRADGNDFRDHRIKSSTRN